jgi:hypothetical protein
MTREVMPISEMSMLMLMLRGWQYITPGTRADYDGATSVAVPTSKHNE